MMDDDSNDYVNSEIVCTIAALGCSEGNDYYKSDDCLECLKDLIRFLRIDDDTCNLRRQLGRSKVVEKDLIPVLKSCTFHEQDILEVCIRLLVNLTQPAMICFGEVPKGKIESNQFLEVLSHLQSYKQAFAEKKIMSTIGRELARLLQLGWDDRQEEHTLLIERILLLLRNILHVPADPQAEKRTDEDATVHDQVLWNLHVNGLDDLILYIASSANESRWCMHALEIISHMLREQKPDVLAKTSNQRTSKERDEDITELEILYEREKASKHAASRNGLRCVIQCLERHSNFGGTFTVQDIKALNDENNLLYHRPLQHAKNLSFDCGKNPRRKRKKEVYAKETDSERKSSLSVRVFLKEFCSHVLEHAYNPLMHTVKDNLKHERCQENDESYFLWAMRFFMEFNRKNDFQVAYISETLNVSTIQYVLLLQTKFFDSFLVDREKKVEWSRRLHLAVQAYQELIQHIALLALSKEEVLRDNAKIIKENIFYMTEYRDMFMSLLQKFDPSCQTRSFLKDLISAFHIFIKLLEGHCRTKGRIIVQQKKKRVRRKKSARNNPRAQSVGPLTAEQADELWQEISGDLSAAVQNEDDVIPSIANPFDPVSEVSEEDQRTKCLADIQRNIREKSFGDAVALLRAARDIWPNSSFGENDVDEEREFMCLYDIFRMELPVANVPEIEPNADEENEMTDPEEEELQAVQVREKEFEFSDFLKKLVSPLILQPYCWLLRWYKDNSAQVNHYIIKMLHRVAVDLKTPAILFQLSLFVTFKQILFDPASSKYKELVTFCKYILSTFFALLPNNPAICCELIVWKSADQCYEITEGYGSLAHREGRRSGHTWTFEEEEELKQLYEEFKDTEDLVENILNGIKNEFRSRRQVVNKLITLGLVKDRALVRKQITYRNAWPEEEENELRNLFEEFKDSDDIVGGIMRALSNETRSRRQVVNKLVALGLVQDKESLKKKPANKNLWTEEEEDELGNMFEEFKASEDVVGNIMFGLSKSRSRRQVVNQLVKLNIVEDRKVLRKRRSKSSAKGRNKNEYEDEEDENEADGDENFDDHSDEESDEEYEDGDDGGDDLCSMIPLLRSTEHLDQLEWIKSRLTNAAEDREEDDDWEPLPLVTLTEESALALKNKDFQKMLKRLGLAPPSNEQESYWRIPGNMSPDQLRKAVNDLEAAVQQENSHSPGVRNARTNPKRERLAQLAATLKSSDKRAERANKRKARHLENTLNHERQDRAKQRTMNPADENEFSEDERSEKGPFEAEPDLSGEVEVRGQPSSSSKLKRKRLRMEESDESDQEMPQARPGVNTDSMQNGDTLDVHQEHESVDNLGSEDESMGKKRSRFEGIEESGDSGDEDIFDLPLIRTKRARRAVLDDDDDDDEH